MNVRVDDRNGAAAASACRLDIPAAAANRNVLRFMALFYHWWPAIVDPRFRGDDTRFVIPAKAGIQVFFLRSGERKLMEHSLRMTRPGKQTAEY